ncbi:MAG TPA: M61 family peptidase [Nannocystis exedens]|nr:M61 family peptidase [Nannocystis exedens]
MLRHLAISTLTAFVLLAGGSAVHAAPAKVASSKAAVKERPFTYRVSMKNPARHEFQVEIGLSQVPGKTVDLQIPRWNPGHYSRTDAQRNIRAVVAKSGGKALPVEKIDAITWRVHNGGKPFRLSYRVFRGKYSGVSGAYLDDAWGFFNGAQILMYVVGQKSRPVELKIDPLPGASVATGLPRGGGSHTFKASDYDVLIDSPVQVSKLDVLRFEVAKTPFRIAIAGSGSYDKSQLIADFSKIATAAFEVFGGSPDGIPFKDYTFIVHLRPGARGGLEHLNSTVIGADPYAFSDPASYKRFLNLVAHEFFHLWNVKRIRPAVLGPFAYDREVHTGMLWFSEGVTSYYAWLILSRAGLLNEAETLEKLASVIARLQETPGRKLITVEQASWETWSKPDDGANAYVDYYTKGMLLGMVLDLELRRATAGRASMDSIFAELWRRFRENGRGIYPSELEELVLRQAGVGGADQAIKKLYASYVHGLDEIDYNKHLQAAGYVLSVDVDASIGDLGIDLRGRDQNVTISRVEPAGPGDLGGLASGDRLVAIDGLAVDLARTKRQIRAMRAGSSHAVTVIRGGRLIERQIKAAGGGEVKYKIASLPAPSLEQLAIRNAWLGLKPTAGSLSPQQPGTPPTPASLQPGGGLILAPRG